MKVVLEITLDGCDSYEMEKQAILDTLEIALDFTNVNVEVVSIE